MDAILSKNPSFHKPQHRGKKYCAPFCGRGCTWDEFQTAKRDAKKLATSLGKGWKPNVWENLGWHYSAISPCGRIKVHKGFIAFLGDPDSSGGRWAEHGKTAKSAIRNTIAVAKAELKKIGGYLTGLPNF